MITEQRIRASTELLQEAADALNRSLIAWNALNKAEKE